MTDGKRQELIGDNLHFANRLRRASESTEAYFGARKGIGKGFV